VWNVKLRCNWSTPPSCISRMYERRPSKMLDSNLPIKFSKSIFSHKNSKQHSLDGNSFQEPRSSETLCSPILVKIPKDNDIKNVIDSTAHYVSKYGSEFEFYIIQQEKRKHTGLFEFLFEVESSDHFYYRWYYSFCFDCKHKSKAFMEFF